MPSNLFDLTHANASWFGRRNQNDYEIYLDAGKRIKFSFTGTTCRIFAKSDYADGVTKGFAVSVNGGAWTLYGPTTFGSGTVIANVAEGTHTIEIDGDYNNAGAGTLKLRRLVDGGAVEVTGANPSVQYATGFGRVRHFGNTDTDPLRQLAGWMSLTGSVLNFDTLVSGLNAGSQIRIRTADRYLYCYYTSRGNAPEVCVFDGRTSTRGAILAYGTLASSTEDAVMVLDTGLTDGVARDLVLGVGGVPPASIGTEGTGLLTLGADWPIAASLGTSLTVTAKLNVAAFNQSSKSWPNQVGVRFGWLVVNFGVGGSSLSDYGGLISGGAPNALGRDREDEVATLGASIVLTNHYVNDAHAASQGAAITPTMFGSQMQAHLTALTAMPNVQKVYALGGETAYESGLRSTWLPKISQAVAAVNTANNDTRCTYLSTDAFYASVDLYDGVHPTVVGADQIADGVETVLRATLDNTPPDLLIASTDEGGVQVSLGFDEAMASGYDGLTVKINGTSASVLSYAWNGQKTILTLTMGRGITSTDVVTLDYAPGTLTDFAGNALASFTGHSVSNNSTVSGGGGSDVAFIATPMEISWAGKCKCSVIELRAGDCVPKRVHLTDANGAPVSVATGTLTAKFVQAGVVKVPSLTITTIAADEGFINVLLDTRTGLTGVSSCDLVIQWTDGTTVLLFEAPVRIG